MTRANQTALPGYTFGARLCAEGTPAPFADTFAAPSLSAQYSATAHRGVVSRMRMDLAAERGAKYGATR